MVHSRDFETIKRSARMEYYNKLKAGAKAGTIPTTPDRVDRALGYAMRKNFRPAIEYMSSDQECYCPDRAATGLVCKHILFWKILAYVANALQEELG